MSKDKQGMWQMSKSNQIAAMAYGLGSAAMAIAAILAVLNLFGAGFDEGTELIIGGALLLVLAPSLTRRSA